ncbi:MAG: MATE family efflux transporter [Halioglobus sp.]
MGNAGASLWHEWRALLAIAAPMMIAQVAQMGTGVVDTIMAARYNAVDLAAIAIGYNIWLPIYLVFIGVMLGATTLIAQDFGAGRIEKIRNSLPQSLWLASAVGLVFAPLCYFSNPLLGLLNLDASTHAKALAYLQATAFGLPATAIFQALRCHTQGIGIMRPFAIASVIGFLANIPLNYAFIYGKWGAPELGAAGCGWATALSMWLSPLLMSIYMARAKNLRQYLPPFKWVRPNWAIQRDIARLGAPIGLTFFLEVAVFSIIGLAIATLGNTAMAAHQIAYNVWDVAYILLISIGSAMGTRVGQGIGAGSHAQVKRAIACGAATNVLIAIVCMAALLLGPQLIIGVYTSDREITGMVTALITLAAFFIVIDACQVTVTFALRAFKDTAFPFYVLCGVYWFITLPLGVYLGLELASEPLEGTLGFWKAMILGVGITMFVLLIRLRNRLQQPL